MEENKEQKELVSLKQLPIIEQQLIIVSNEIDETMKGLSELICNEENRQVIKNLRAKYKKEVENWEIKRKDIKKKILAPYEEFEKIYNACIFNKYKNADEILKAKIDEVENILKTNLENDAREYFKEYQKLNEIDFIKFENMNYKVGLSDNPTKLKKIITAFIDRVKKDLELINIQEHKVEVLVEYKKSLDVNQAIINVSERLKKEEFERAKVAIEQKVMEDSYIPKEKMEIGNPTGQAIVSESLKAPKKVESQALMDAVFKIKNETKERLLQVKKFLEDGGYDYE